MPSISSVVTGRAALASGGAVRGVRVRVRDRAISEPGEPLLWAMLAAGLLGIAAGVVSTDPSLFLGWLS